MAELARWIAHVDMDAFFAGVALLAYPELAERPVVIGGPRPADGPPRPSRLADYVGRGVAVTATYPARAFGIRSGLGLMKAAKLCPEALLLPVDGEQVRLRSRQFKAVIAARASQLEDLGVDEVFVDLGAAGARDRATACALARRLAAEIHAVTGLTCSIGLAPNKLLAKLASDLEKPRGLTVIEPADVTSRIWPLPVRRLSGVGPRAEATLAAMGITTIGALAAAEPSALVARFGTKTAAWLRAAAHGHDERPLVLVRARKRMSRETTFPRDLTIWADRAELGRILTGLCDRLASDLRARGLVARGVGVKVKFGDFRVVTRDCALAAPTDAPQALRAAARRCLSRIELTAPLRLLGLRVDRLGPVADPPASPDGGSARLEPAVQLSLFEGRAAGHAGQAGSRRARRSVCTAWRRTWARAWAGAIGAPNRRPTRRRRTSRPNRPGRTLARAALDHREPQRPDKAAGITGTGVAATTCSIPRLNSASSPSRVRLPSGKITTSSPSESARAISSNAARNTAGSVRRDSIGITSPTRNNQRSSGSRQVHVTFMTKRGALGSAAIKNAQSMKVTWLATTIAGPRAGTRSTPSTVKR